MNFQWMSPAAPCPIIEFHDIRTERARAEDYLALVETRFAAPLLAAGGAPLGYFHVVGHPDRLILLRGFASIPARRNALTAFYASAEWARHRQEATGLVRESETALTRAVTPADGIRPIRPGDALIGLISEVRFAEQIGSYHLWLRLLLRKAGLDPIAAFATLEAVNDVPAVPVLRHRSRHIALLRPTGGGVPELPRELAGMLRFPPEVLRLQPAPALVW
ncbi:MAG: hypothetical protein Q7T08_01115 [Devosia sp.]|nr:hypothetical protein [Devosia sp.]